MATTVTNFSELKSAIEDSSTTEISVTNDITFASGGAKVNITKKELVIDFNGHTVTDYNSLTFTDTIYVSSTTNTISVTVKNAIWSGRNYYGVVGVYNGDVNTTINLENITYTGPQFVYNKNGTTKISDCNILLVKNESTTNPQEFCEANRLIISGNVSVDSRATGDAVIWFTGTNASLTVEENATFTVEALLTYLLYTDVSPVITLKQFSKTTITTKTGLFYASGSSTHIASSFTLEENASFIAYKKDSNSVPMFKCLSNLTISKNSTFQLYSELISSTYLMYFGQVANIKIDNPKSVVLYNRGGDIFSFQSGSTSNPNIININTEMLRLWNVATYPLTSAGGFSDVPTTEYFKSNYSTNLNLTLSVASAKLVSAENNLIEGDNGYPLNTTTLKILTSKVVSMGTLPLSVNTITDLSTQIAGQSLPQANIKAEYNQESLTTTADDGGNFSFDLSQALAVDTDVVIGVNKDFLTKTLSFISEGSVSITHVDNLNFYAFTTSSNLSLIYRQNADFGLTVTDTRTSGEEWYLYSYINEPLTSGENKLDDTIIFKQNDTQTTLSQNPILVYTGKWNASNQTTAISWKAIEGFLLNIEPEKLYIAGNYTTNLLWQVSTTKL